MRTGIPLFISTLLIPVVSWMNFSSTFILFGIYYGFLTTLPISPSQLLCIRAFLLEGNISGTVAISGLIIGQLITFLSIYYSPIYVILIKPHTLSLVILSYIFFYWYRIKDLLNYQSLRPIKSFRDIRIFQLFFDSLVFQLLNPILLPSPVLARLLNLFFFRHSQSILFVTSTIFGWLFGQSIFINLSKLLLFCVESDSPILYLLVKRIIHRIFSIIILSFSLLHLGRIPVPFITKKIIENLQFNSSKREDSIFSRKSWPDLFFDYRRWKRPFRYIENSRFSTRSPIKRRVSQYFFNSCLSDGKPRLSFTCLPSVAIFGKNFEKYNYSEFSSSGKFFGEWFNTKRQKRQKIYTKIQDGIQFLDKGFTPIEILEKKKGLSNFKGETFTKFYDPLLIRQSHEAMIISKSAWFFTEKFDKSRRTQKLIFFIGKNNKLKYWISNQWKNLEYKNFVLPWEPLSRDARRILSLLINKSEKVKHDTNLKQINFFDTDIKKASNDKNSNLPVSFIRKKVNRKPNLNWELILNLSTRQKNLYFNYLEQDEWNTFKNYWKKLFLGDITQVKNILPFLAKTLRIDKKFLLRDMDKEIPRWTPDSKNDKFDVIAIGVTDIRQRKVKNLGYLIKGKDKRKKLVRRFSQQSDFRRKLVKGSMRARRRKTLIWKMFQLKANSPFFLRIIEKPTSIKTYSDLQPSYGSTELTFRVSLEEKRNNFFKEKISLFEKTKADRLAIANRWDFPLAQWGRSWLLITQSHFRKYFVLPLLIILKNFSRFLLFQKTEWTEDWSEWNKEIHIRCTYDGTEVSKEELPEQWLRDGLQIKIVYPFRLKPWHNLKSQNLILGKKKFHYCYLTAWGFLTDLPFGNIKKQPSFWKPIKRELKKKWEKNLFFKIFKQIKEKFIQPHSSGSKTSDIQFAKSPKVNLYDLGSEKEYIKNTETNNSNIQQFLAERNDKITSEIPKKIVESKTSIYIKNLEELLTKKNLKEKKVYFNHNNYNFHEKAKIEKPVKQLIQIKQKMIRIYKKSFRLVKKSFSILNLNIQTIIINSKINIEIIKEFIGSRFNN